MQTVNPQQEFMRWLSQRFPQVHRETMKKVNIMEDMNVNTSFGFGDAQTGDNTPWYQKAFSILGDVAAQYTQYKAQRDLIKMNMKRAEQGLPPIDSKDVSPSVNVNVSADWQKMFGQLKVPLMIGGGLLAFALIAKKSR